jgi:hypothetical protein
MKKIFLSILCISFLVSSCGKSTIEVMNNSYEPKIAIEGYLVANQPLEKIHIARNFRLDTDLNRTVLIPDVNQTRVTITDIQENRKYNLSFHLAPDNKFDNYYWYRNGNDLKIQAGKSYQLDVSAIIDGEKLSASSVTTVPAEGFHIVNLNYDSLTYRQKDSQDELMKFNLVIQRSPECDFYFTSIKALHPTLDNFIYDNPYEDIKPEDIKPVDDCFNYQWIQNMPTSAGQSNIEIYWESIWFYDTYQIIVYAVDENYRLFLQTYDDVQEDDGNFHEPKFNIQGDGIGVFGSMIADTVYVKVMK